MGRGVSNRSEDDEGILYRELFEFRLYEDPTKDDEGSDSREHEVNSEPHWRPGGGVEVGGILHL